MTILDWLMLIIGLLLILPSIVYLTIKFGVVGFYKGKEAYKKESESELNELEDK